LRTLGVRHFSYRIPSTRHRSGSNTEDTIAAAATGQNPKTKSVEVCIPDWAVLTALGRYSRERPQWQTSSTPLVNILRPSASRIVELMMKLELVSSPIRLKSVEETFYGNDVNRRFKTRQ
jgi:hypothetical protein